MNSTKTKGGDSRALEVLADMHTLPSQIVIRHGKGDNHIFVDIIPFFNSLYTTTGIQFLMF